MDHIRLVNDWLEQFAATDRGTAISLLKAIDYISQQTMLRNIHSYVAKLTKELPKPIAILPVREMVKGQSYYSADINAKPKLLQPSSYPGSEALFANLATTLQRLGRRDKYTFSPSLRNMRDAKCRTIFLLDDFIGSGQRVDTFITSLLAHRTMKSWWSFGYIKLHVVAYSGTSLGIKKVTKNKYCSDVHICVDPITIKDKYIDDDLIKQIKDLCYRYAGIKEEMPLGFNNSMGAMVFEHSAPNNLPAILWRVRKNWKPLFPNRAVPDDLFELFQEKQNQNNSLPLNIESIQKSHYFKNLPSAMIDMIVVLSAIKNGANSIGNVAKEISKSYALTTRIIVKCKELDFIDEDLSLTARGQCEINHANSLISLIQEQNPLASEKNFYYYPRSLRASSG